VESLREWEELGRALKPFGLFVLAWAVASRAERKWGISGRFRAPGASALDLLAGFVLAFFFSTAALYPGTPSFNNNLEPAVADAAVLLAKGRPAFAGPESGACAVIPYGPLTFLLPAGLHAAGAGPIEGPKWAGVLQMAAGMLALFLALAKTASFRAAWRGAGLAALLLMAFKHFAYWDRPESLLLLAGGLGALAASLRAPPAVFALLVPASALAFGTKIHGLLYLVPFLPFFLRTLRGPTLLAAVALGLVSSLLPFLSPSLPPGPWFTHLREVVALHPLELDLGIATLGRLALIVLLPLWLWRRRAEEGRTGSLFLLSWVLPCLLLLWPASKNGAGPHHVLPFVPAVVLWIAFPVPALRPGPRLSPVLLAMICVLGILVVKGQKSVLRYLLSRGPAMAEARKECEEWAAEYRGLDLVAGFTDRKGEEVTYLRPLVVAASGLSLLELPAIKEHELAGLPVPPSLVEAVRSGKHRFILLPSRGRAFSLSWEPLDSSWNLRPLRRAFLSRYRKIRSGRFFEIWERR